MIAEAPTLGLLDEQHVSEPPPESQFVPENRDRELARSIQEGQTAFRMAQVFYPDEVKTDDRFLTAQKHALIALLPPKYVIPLPFTKEEIATMLPPDIDHLYDLIANGMTRVTTTVTENLGLVAHIARNAQRKYGKTGRMTYDDYFGIGAEGAMKATVRYDHTRGPFSSYLGAKIDFAMRDTQRTATHARREITDSDTNQVSLSTRLSSDNGHAYSGDTDSTNIGDMLPATRLEYNTEPAVMIYDAYRQIPHAIDQLDPREKIVFIATIVDGRKNSELISELGVSASRISQLRAEVLNKVRANISNPFDDEESA